MFTLGKSCVALSFLLLLLATYICIFQEFWQPRCTKPFVKIGKRCYFFSTNKATSYEYYKLSYKGSSFSVPAMLDWLHASFGCETLDSKAHLVSIESDREMRDLAAYLHQQAHADTSPMFWSSGHRGHMVHMDVKPLTLNNFYWHHDALPMNFTNWAEAHPQQQRFPEGFCVYLEFMRGHELVMGTAHCDKKLAYVCELQSR